MSAAGSADGFTLIEMLVVMALAGLIAALGWPQLRGSLAKAELARGAAAVTAVLREARAAALLRAVPVQVGVLPDGGGLRIDDRAPVAVPASVRVQADRVLRFYADGSSSGGSVVVRGAGAPRRIAVQPATGLIAATTVSAGGR
ncbi:MAG: type IV pilin protein [Polymorphobacter sp.]